MRVYLKKNINLLIGIFILLQPIIDLLTGLGLHTFRTGVTVGIVIRIIFLLFICYNCLFTFKKRQLFIPYVLIFIYSILYILGIVIYKHDVNLFQELQGLIKVFYFPTLLVSLYSIREEIRISKLVLVTELYIYLILIFLPIILGIGYDSYKITKAGTLGFYNSANEISGIISLITPIMFIVISTSKKIIPKIILTIIYLTVILMIGTKTPLLALIITTVMSLIYFNIKEYKQKKYRNIALSLLFTIITFIGISIIVPKTNFYKNIQTHLDYLKVDDISDVFKDEHLVDHFVFSQRLTFLKNKAYLYNSSNNYHKLFGMGYLKNNKQTKLIEMDYFDIFYSHGIIGFLVFFTIVGYVLYMMVKEQQKITYDRYMLLTSFLLIIILSFFTGHILTAPSVSIVVTVIIISLGKKFKKDLLFADRNMEIGGIEQAQLNLLNRIDYNKYNVVLVLEEKKGELLSQLNKNIKVVEVKVSTNSNFLIRKTINVLRKLNFKLFNYMNYDFSCCYTTYSYSSNKIAKMASLNNAFYVHSDYKNVYSNEKEFKHFFDSRKVSEYRKIIFVSNEARDSFINVYKDLKEKTLVLNNFIDVDNILLKSKEKIKEKNNSKRKLFMYVGRLDDSSKKLKRAIYLVSKINDIELWIVGNGPDKKMYEKYTTELNLDNRIKFLGKKENPYSYMNKSDYIIMTSDYEGFPVVYLEALALNKKIITTINTSDDIINMKDYSYIVSKDEDKMVKDVKKVLTIEKKLKDIDIEKIQKSRMEKFEELFDE